MALRNIDQCNGRYPNSSFESGKGIRYRNFGNNTGVFGGGQDVKVTFMIHAGEGYGAKGKGGRAKESQYFAG